MNEFANYMIEMKDEAAAQFRAGCHDPAFYAANPDFDLFRRELNHCGGFNAVPKGELGNIFVLAASPHDWWSPLEEHAVATIKRLNQPDFSSIIVRAYKTPVVEQGIAPPCPV